MNKKYLVLSIVGGIVTIAAGVAGIMVLCNNRKKKYIGDGNEFDLLND